MIGGHAQRVPGAAGTTQAISRLGIPSTVLTDGPAGVRINPRRDNDQNTYFCTGFPVGTALACTWNTQLVEEVGKCIGNEVLEYGCDVLLAPGIFGRNRHGIKIFLFQEGSWNYTLFHNPL